MLKMGIRLRSLNRWPNVKAIEAVIVLRVFEGRAALIIIINAATAAVAILILLLFFWRWRVFLLQW